MAVNGKEIITTENAPQAIGPYSVGVKCGSFVFTAGQIGLDPKSGTMVSGGVEFETRQALQNLQNILESAGSSMRSVEKTTVYLSDMNNFARMNSVYAEFFSENPPARSAVQAAALPKNAEVEIEAIALV